MRAAFYECDVTPPLGGFMWGHYTPKYAEDVIDRLYVKALVVEEEGELAAIVVVDTCALPPEMHDIVTKRITEYTGIPAERVCITSNHTHWGAPVSEDNTVGCKVDEPYKDVFFRLTADAVILAYKRLADAEASFGTDEVEGITFCRNYIMEDGTVITHGRNGKAIKGILAKPDNALSVMTFRRGDEVIGSLINFSCHQCCCGGIKGYSGDYSSILSKELKKKFGPDYVSLFVLAPCGDITHVNNDHSIKAPNGWYREMGRRIAEKTLAAIEKSVPVPHAVSVCKEKITLQKRLAPVDETIAMLQKRLNADRSLMKVRNLVYYQATNTETEASLWLQTIRIGDVCIYCMPGEVFICYSYRLKAESPFAKNIIIENCGDYCGYIPSVEAFGENCDLYETSLCHHSCLEVQAGNKIVDQLLQMSKKI